MKKYLLTIIMFSLCLSMIACNPINFINKPKNDDTSSDSTSTTEPPTDGFTTTADQHPTPTPPKEDSSKKSIDLYIIAGQSNAAGYTAIDENLLATLWADYNVGSPNVLYRGIAESTLNSGTSSVQTLENNVRQWTNAKAGQGKTTSHMGAEVGMAAVLSKTYYTGNKTAGIIKYAHGGTSLFNRTGGENAANGNWVSPSYAQNNGLSYSGLTGNLYRNLLSTVSESAVQLKLKGYNDIHIKGIFWMQGESDRGDPTAYKAALKLFISDIRNDLAKITGDAPEDIAFMIGEISETSESALSHITSYNVNFIAMQRQVANEVPNVYAIPSGQYKINWLDGSGANKYGQDSWHWTTEPMFRIGELVAQCILDHIVDYQK